MLARVRACLLRLLTNRSWRLLLSTASARSNRRLSLPSRAIRPAQGPSRGPAGLRHTMYAHPFGSEGKRRCVQSSLASLSLALSSSCAILTLRPLVPSYFSFELNNTPQPEQSGRTHPTTLTTSSTLPFITPSPRPLRPRHPPTDFPYLSLPSSPFPPLPPALLLQSMSSPTPTSSRRLQRPTSRPRNASNTPRLQRSGRPKRRTRWSCWFRGRERRGWEKRRCWGWRLCVGGFRSRCFF